MTFISLQSMSYSIGVRCLFDQVSLTLSKDHKMGVMGRNGSGKTTLLRLIQKDLSPDSGRIVMSKGLILGVMTQHDTVHPNETVMDWVVRTTHAPTWDISKLAGQLGLTEHQLNHSYHLLSGGYRMRAKCVALMALNPDFILLDEPTNFLDLPTLIAFSKVLKSYEGGMLVVSHDRGFLNDLCSHTLEVANHTLTLYPGTVDAYLRHKQEKQAIIESTNRNIERKQAHLERFISRFRAKASKATQAQSKLKQLAKLSLIEEESDAPMVRIRFPSTVIPKGTALRMESLGIGYTDRPIAGPLNWQIDRGERVGIVGGNGQGKTTFLNTLAGIIPPLSGQVIWTHGAKLGIFTQHVINQISGEESILDYLMAQVDDGVTLQQIMDTAGGFLFSGDDMLKPLSVLSGGEKARVVLATLLLLRPTVLLLDEPTNHLDFETVEWLADGLKSYPGTVLVISHDPSFIKAVTTQLCEVDRGIIRPFPGDLDDYIASITQKLMPLHQAPSTQKMPTSTNQKDAGSRSNQRRQLTKEIATLEKKIDQYSTKKATLLRFFMTDPLGYSDKKAEELEQVTNTLQELESDWDEATTRLLELDTPPN